MCRKARGTKQWQGEQGTCRKLIAKPTTPMPSFLQPTRHFSWDWSKEKKSKRLHWLGGRSSIHVMHVSLLGTRRGPGWSTGWQTPHTGSHKGQARHPVPGECPCQETQRLSTSNPPPQLCFREGKKNLKKIKALKIVWQDRFYLQSHIWNPARLLWVTLSCPG